jgi:hypothetical protein
VSGLQSRIELIGARDVFQKFNKAPKAVQVEAVKVIQQQATPMIDAARRATFTPIQRHAANAIDVRRDQVGVTIAGAAAGSALDRALYYGGEYGGRKSKKVVYATRSPRGRAYVVHRRTTMQFLPHLGREGYFLWPTVRDWLPKINQSIGDAVVKVLS